MPGSGCFLREVPGSGLGAKEVMVNKILQLLSIRCSHKKISQPFAAASSSRRAVNSDWDMPAPASEHYVVCLDCGHKFQYDWAKMRVIE